MHFQEHAFWYNVSDTLSPDAVNDFEFNWLVLLQDKKYNIKLKNVKANNESIANFALSALEEV